MSNPVLGMLLEPPSFTLPVQGSVVKWKMLSVHEQLTVTNAYRADAQKVFLEAALLAAQIVQLGDRPQPGCSLGEIGAWNEIDYTMFRDFVEDYQKEQHRRFRKKQANEVGPAMYLQKAMQDFREALGKVDTALMDALEAAKLAEAPVGPLK